MVLWSLTLLQVAVKVIMVMDKVTGKVNSATLQKFRKVFLSTLHPGTSNVFLEQRGHREQEVWISLFHPHIVPIWGITTNFPPTFLVSNPIAIISPWMKNGNLFDALKSTPSLEEPALLRLVRFTNTMRALYAN